jgi:hypothetical protein
VGSEWNIVRTMRNPSDNDENLRDNDENLRDTFETILA